MEEEKKPETKFRNTKTVSASISNEFYKIAEARGISWTEAMRIGLAVLFAEKGIKEFLTDLTVTRITTIFNAIIENRNKNEQTIHS